MKYVFAFAFICFGNCTQICNITTNGGLFLDYSSLRMGVAANTNVVLAGKYPQFWTCRLATTSQQAVYYPATGFFTADVRYRRGFGFSMFKNSTLGGYSLYYGEGCQRNQRACELGERVVLKICSFNRSSPLDFAQVGFNDTDCLLNFVGSDKWGSIVGVTTYGDVVHIHWTDGVRYIRVPGASEWNTVGVKCYYSASCVHSLVSSVLRVNVTTDSVANTTSYIPLSNVTHPTVGMYCVDGWYNATSISSLQLGLPLNSTALVTGLLPQFWHCASRQHSDSIIRSYNGRGVFILDTKPGAHAVSIMSNTSDCVSKYCLYYGNAASGSFTLVKICKWPARPALNAPSVTTGEQCLLKRASVDQFNQVIGFTTSGNTVRIHWQDGVHSLYVPGAEEWNLVNVKCADIASCYFSIVDQPITVNVTTVQGRIVEYDVCPTCTGFADNIFSVDDGGYIPSGFSFNNWFLLTNSSSIVEGVVRTTQPLLLNCLWPVPGLQSTTGYVYFNGTGRGDCNGFSSNALSDFMRFNLNFSDSSDQNLRTGTIIFKAVYGDAIFYCSNTTLQASKPFVPFGLVEETYYCFINSTIGNTTTTSFIGAMPRTVREFVVSREGHFYINGYRYFSLGNLEAVNFNITAATSTDFWTVAFANYTDVLVNVSATDINNVLYCNNDVNKLRCDQLTFDLKDGFYSSEAIYNPVLPQTLVSLPAYYRHSNVSLYVGFTPQSGSGSCWNCYPQSTNVTLAGYNDSTNMMCVETTHYTTQYFSTVSDVGTWYSRIDAGDCPFSFDKLNNFLKFGSICFSTRAIAGGCSMPIIASWSGINDYTIGSLYVSWTDGDRVSGVPRPIQGVQSFVDIKIDECTRYSIYGKSGTGVIRQTSDNFIAGIYYTSLSGDLLGFKDVVNGTIYSITPCHPPDQVVVYQQNIVGAMMSENVTRYGLSDVRELPNFYYRSNGAYNCTKPVLTYSNFGICADGSIITVPPKNVSTNGVSAIVTANLSIPTNWSSSVQVEYLQITNTPVVVDCTTYVCNGNHRCNELLKQYTSACSTIEQALHLSARLESAEVSSMLTYDDNAFMLANISSFGEYNLSSVLPSLPSGSGRTGRSVVEDLLFNKVVTSGLGTVDADYKSCSKGLSIADLACAQYYNGIMVLPGVADAERMAMYTGSLIGGMALGGITGAAAIPFSLAVQARLNYVALQTDVLQRNQQMIADSFNKAMLNVVDAFTNVNDALSQTSQAVQTVASALNKVQEVVNHQGRALNQLTLQLRQNFQAISSSIQAIYDRLDDIQADQQVDRLINGRLAALNAFVAQTLTKYTEVRALRQLATEKVNECVKSQSSRYGFCGNGTHLFSIVNAAPEGLLFMHTVLIPTAHVSVEAYSGLCVDGVKGFVLRQPNLALYKDDAGFKITSRIMFEPRIPTIADFARIVDCNVTFVNATSETLPTIIPDYVDVNQTLEEFLERLPNVNSSAPDLPLDIYNQTILNLTAEITDLENKSAVLNETVQNLNKLIDNINNTLVNLEWLNRVETYIKWPWWVWLCIVIVLIFTVGLLLLCCCATGCCGCCSCLSSSCRGCCESTKLPYYDVEKIHIQ
uniref:Spike glycoprotein n=1 Tax=229E-related bat coronavirus TaxID=1739614 RepID=A0A0P0KH07_CVH22|nr:spike glycoprotein [229E-related bat coronavirus]